MNARAKSLTLSALSDKIGVLRQWWAEYVHDGVTLAPDDVAQMIDLLGDLTEIAEDYENLLRQTNMLLTGVRTSGLREISKRAIVDEALAKKGLSAAVFPAAQLLTEEHLKDQRVTLFPRSWKLPPADEAAS